MASTFTEPELKTIYSLMMRIWDEIGMDVLNAVADEKGKTVEQVSIPSRDVIELVLDAGRLEHLLTQNAPTIVDRWKAGTYEEHKKIARKVFTYGRYGA